MNITTNINFDTIKFSSNILSEFTNITYNFKQYLKNNGFDKLYIDNSKKNKVRIQSNECMEFIKGNSNSFTIVQTQKVRENIMTFEFYGLKSYCDCVDSYRKNIIILFLAWIESNSFINNVKIIGADLAIDFIDIHPIQIKLNRPIQKGKPPKISQMPSSKDYYKNNTFYMYDDNYLIFEVNKDYDDRDIKKCYKELFGDELYLIYYEKELKFAKNIIEDFYSSSMNLLGMKIDNNFIPYTHTKPAVDKINSIQSKHKIISDATIYNNKDIFFNLDRYKNDTFYIKEVKKKNKNKEDIIELELYVKKQLYIDNQKINILINDLKHDKIIFSKKNIKKYQVKLYDKFKKISDKYLVKIPFTNMSRVEMSLKYDKGENKRGMILKKIDALEILVDNKKINIYNEIEKYLSEELPYYSCT